MGKVTVIADIDYISGHLRYGHYELEMDEETFKNLSKEDLKELINDRGELIVDDYEIEDHGDITDIRLA